MSPEQKAGAMLAAFKTGREEAIRLFAPLLGFGPCPGCDFITEHCRCSTHATDHQKGK